MKLYIASASKSPNIETVEHYIRLIRAQALHNLSTDIEITYDWTIAVRKAGDGSPDDANTRLAAVLNDMAGVRAADLVWVIAPPVASTSTGAWFEMGYAVGCAVPFITSGDVKRCIFADLALKQFVTDDEAFAFIRRAL